MNSASERSQGVDWGGGHYEKAAEQLLPAARVVVDRAALAAGERVVDVGCGTGNAALLAAARGAHVVGVDPAPRLLDVARAQALAQGVDATFVAGEAAALPLDDGEADVVLSVFGVIFAPDVPAAAAEVARVTAPGGRIVLSAWIPKGPISDFVGVVREAVDRALGRQAGSPPFAWHDPEALAALLGPHGFEVSTVEERLAVTAASPGAYLDAESANHPLWVAGRAVLEPRGQLERVCERALAVLEQRNEQPDGCRVTSRYVVATAQL